MVTKVYFIRHAEAFGNAAGVYQGRSDTGLTESGKKQLERLAERFKNVSFDAIYASPLGRTVETAEAANLYHKLPLQLNEGLIELDGGKWEGMTWGDIDKNFPDEHKFWDTRLDLFEAPGGEKVADVQKRMIKTVNDIVSENAGKTIVVVSHGCALRTYFCYVSGYPLIKINEDKWAMNTSVSLVEYDDDLNAKMIYKGDVSHLDGIFVKRF